jgi:hypothetical protein
MPVLNWGGEIEMNPSGMALAGVALAVALLAFILWLRERSRSARLATEAANSQTERAAIEKRLAESRSRNELAEVSLARAQPYLEIADAVVELQRLRNEADQVAADARRDADGVLENARRNAASLIDQANTDASQVDRDARQKARERLEAAEQQLTSAGDQARRIVQEAERRAQEVAGDAYAALRDAKHYERVVEARRWLVQASWTLAADAVEYKETLAINARIASDAEARARWLQQQNEIDPVTSDGESIDEGSLVQAQ